MKVLYVGSDSIASGAGFSMVKLIEELDKFDDIEVVPVVHAGNSERLLSEKGRSHYIVNAWSLALSNRYSSLKRNVIGLTKSVLNIPAYFKYSKIIKKEKPDIVHINAITVPSVFKAALRNKVPVVWQIRELLEEDLNSTFFCRDKVYSQMKKADMFIAISKCVKEKYERIVGNDRIRLVYNGVDKNLFYSPEHRILANKKITVTMAGRIIKEKGQLLCLKSLLPLLKKNPDIVLQFAGTGMESELSALRSLAEPVKDQVKFLGFVKDMQAVWEQSDIAVVYSKFEAFGRVTVEAKMSGALVIGYNSGGTSELIEDGVDGLLFDEDKSVCEAVEWAIGNKEKARSIAYEGMERASEVFNSQRNAQEVCNVYKEVFKKAHNSR